MFYPFWSYKYSLEYTLRGTFRIYKEYGLFDTFDEIKGMILDTNKYLFILGIVVSSLHALFEFLAIKNGFFQVNFLLILKISNSGIT